VVAHRPPPLTTNRLATPANVARPGLGPAARGVQGGHRAGLAVDGPHLAVEYCDGDGSLETAYVPVTHRLGGSTRVSCPLPESATHTAPAEVVTPMGT
jgi:hypothetical protein